MGSAKGTDEHRRIYNPQSTEDDYLQLVSKDELYRIGWYIYKITSHLSLCINKYSQVDQGTITCDIASHLKDVTSFAQYVNKSHAIR